MIYMIVPMYNGNPVPYPLFFSQQIMKAIRIAKHWNAGLELKRLLHAGRCTALDDQPDEYVVVEATAPIGHRPYYIGRANLDIRAQYRETLPKHANDPYIRITLDRIYPNGIFGSP
jgi:hypothetical protein